MEPVLSGNSGPRLTVGVGGVTKLPIDAKADPYGNDMVFVSHGEDTQTTTVESGAAVGVQAEVEVALPEGIGVEYSLSFVALSGSTDVDAQGGDEVALDQGMFALENSLQLTGTPIGNDPAAGFRLTLKTGATLLSVQRDQTTLEMGAAPATVSESSYFDHQLGLTGGVDIGFGLGSGFGLELGASVDYFPGAGASLGADLGLTYSL